MALVEPLVGHLLSQYTETVKEGFEKIRRNAENDAEFAVTFMSHPQGVQAMKNCLGKGELIIPVMETLCVLVACSEKPLKESSSLTKGQQRGARLSLIREFCSGDAFVTLRKALSVLSDATLPTATATLQFLTTAATYAPKMLMARFNNKIPLHYACFRSQLPYSQRRIRLARLEFLLCLADSKHNVHSAEVVSAHGFLTSVFEDAAEVLQDGSAPGQVAGKRALHMFQNRFIVSAAIPAAQKRSVLMGQRNIFRLLVKALDLPTVADDVARVMFHMVTQLAESPADYASSRVEAADDRGMPNFPIFFLLRQLRPNTSALASRIVLFILTTLPDLIRPYFARVSGHLADEGNLLHRVAPSTARVATMNVLTRIFMAPIPYHLVSRRATLEPVAAKANTFYTMSPRDVADEICPQWVAEYVHKVINGSSNIMTLALAAQLTQAALARAKAVLALVAEIQREQAARRDSSEAQHRGPVDGKGAGSTGLDAADIALFTAEDTLEESDDFDAHVLSHLLTALPRREEFWHRMTQQLHPMMLEMYKRTTRPSEDATAGNAEKEEEAQKRQAKLEFAFQRLSLVMHSYTDVFNLRVSWLSVTPTFLPSLVPVRKEDASSSVIGKAMAAGNDLLSGVSAQTISTICDLLVASLARGVAMPKLHHITMSNPKGGITEWPLLLSLLLWASRHRGDAKAQEAIIWVAKVVQWVVHSVTVRHGCTLEEALLWVNGLTPEAIPCFLHMLNNLLQRSLSKAADRVAQELLQDTGAENKGLLLAASEAFVAKAEEKASATAANGSQGNAAASSPAAAGKRKRGEATSVKGGSGGAMELWMEHMRESLSAYRSVMKSVAAASRSGATGITSTSQGRSGSDNADENNDGGRAFIFNLALATSRTQRQDAMSRALHHGLMARPPACEQLKVFCSLLSDPLAQLGGSGTVDAAGGGAHGGTMSVVEIGLLALVQDAKKPLCTVATPLVGALTKLPPSLWCLMRKLSWEMAGRLIKDLDAAVSIDSSNIKGRVAALTVLQDFAREVLSLVSREEASVSAAFAEQKDGETFPFLVLLLTLLRVELTSAAALSRADGSGVEKGLSLGILENLERIVLALYDGTLSTPDRVCYAALLSLHYLRKLSRAGDASAAKAENEEDSDVDEDDSVDDEDEEEQPENDDEEANGDGHVTALGKAERRDTHSVHLSPKGMMNAPVPVGLQQRRFLVAQHEPASFTTPEVDMLSYIVGMMTEKEIETQALMWPMRLHNNLRCTTRPRPTAATTNASRSGVDLLFSVFPELSTEKDVGVVNLDEMAASQLADPRYLLPLLHTVSALPGQKHRYLISRCTPVLVRALSFTCVSLRRHAVSALFTISQVPQQQRYTTPDGSVASRTATTSRRIIASFARLKMVQLAEKNRRSAAAKKKAPGAVERYVPRLPGPLSAFLVLALDALSSFDHVLHNHFVGFLDDPKSAFSTPVPFASWLTTFPIDSVSSRLMLKQQEETQKSSSMLTTSIAQASAEEAINELRKNTPPQLMFIMQLIHYACGTAGDAVALVESESLDGLALLCELLTASADLRDEVLHCLLTVCTASSVVASQLALRKDGQHGEGGLVLWLLSYLQQLNREYGADVVAYSRAPYTTALKLLRLLCATAATSPRRASTMSAVERSRMQIAGQLRLIRTHLHTVRVTAKEVLDAADDCVQQWSRADQHHPQQELVEKERVVGAGSTSTMKATEAVKTPAKRQRSVSPPSKKKATKPKTKAIKPEGKAVASS